MAGDNLPPKLDLPDLLGLADSLPHGPGLGFNDQGFLSLVLGTTAMFQPRT